MNNNGLAQITAFKNKWLPHASMNERNMAQALFLENSYWDNMTNAIAAGIAKAL